MKRIAALALVLALGLTMTGCQRPAQPPEESSSAPGSSQTPQPASTFTRENFPRLNGSTSMVPLGQAIASVLLGESRQEVEDLIQFDRTTASYRALMEGTCDLLLAAEPAPAVYEEKQAQGFDLKPYAGEICTQYLYKIENHPNDPEVYATLLVYGDQIIGGDVASTQVDGFMHGFAPDSAHFGMPQESGTESSQAEAAATPSPAAESSELSSDSSQMTQEELAQTEGTQTPSVETEAAGEVLPEEAYPVD